MTLNRNQQQRVAQLVAEIEVEKDQMKFAALVHELNQVLDEKPLSSVPPPPDGRAKRETQSA
jgi:hypothetical protein